MKVLLSCTTSTSIFQWEQHQKQCSHHDNDVDPIGIERARHFFCHRIRFIIVSNRMHPKTSNLLDVGLPVLSNLCVTYFWNAKEQGTSGVGILPFVPSQKSSASLNSKTNLHSCQVTSNSGLPFVLKHHNLSKQSKKFQDWEWSFREVSKFQVFQDAWKPCVLLKGKKSLSQHEPTLSLR